MDKSQLQCVDIQAPIGSLDAYIHRVNAIPMLTLKEEQSLGRQLQNEGDLRAAQRLVTAHLRYVVRVAKGYMGYGLTLGDLIQEGTVGLMKAVKRFDPDRGIRLVSFAVHWIKSEIHEFILKNWRIVKVATTKAQRKLFFNLRSSKKRLGWFTQAEVEAVAKDLGVKPSEVLQMEQRLNAQDVAFDLPVAEDTEGKALPSPAEYLQAEDADPMQQLSSNNWSSYAKEKFYQVFAKLDPRSRDILTERWLREDVKVTLQSLAKKYSISTERVRQLEKQAIDKMRKMVLESET